MNEFQEIIQIVFFTKCNLHISFLKKITFIHIRLRKLDICVHFYYLFSDIEHIIKKQMQERDLSNINLHLIIT